MYVYFTYHDTHLFKVHQLARWLVPVILATWERIAVSGQSRQIVHETPISEMTITAKWVRGMAQAAEHLL
jgi:hypothetical protein